MKYNEMYCGFKNKKPIYATLDFSERRSEALLLQLLNAVNPNVCINRLPTKFSVSKVAVKVKSIPNPPKS